mmetsp:Transcript_37458/g.43046  ORF Transcript_37458/g.43046 Transcript_37458/m.43046 type:complete len:98 (+) Transcript_37458:299-592(+)|eukprot:CAMPEP_0168336000 /NCGR_PEP_ID=MMETSP0213-20121227/11265_1 /TAXON_ID=151035 /ORGANISM="Euplotes harpa, Strain FSP1.4" /LENGTH=97 /DNA_ID=CAMNT_0008341077 /DNA_START=202 /DNA_END=495 /DNA_ORIENTATION=+
MKNIAEKMQELIYEIKDKESNELEGIRKSFARMSMHEGKEDSEERERDRKQLQLQIDGEIRVMEEAEYMDGMIDERQENIDKIGRIMSDVKEIAKDF